jgi:hypothetical protein
MSDDTADTVDTVSDSGSTYHEPPPSLGMVAHIWAGHLGPAEGESAPPADSEDAVEMAAAEAHPAAVD